MSNHDRQSRARPRGLGLVRRRACQKGQKGRGGKGERCRTSLAPLLLGPTAGLGGRPPVLVLALAAVLAFVVVAFHLLTRPERAHTVLREHARAVLRGLGPADEQSAGSVGSDSPDS